MSGDLISRAAVVKMLHEKRQKTMNSNNDILRREDVVNLATRLKNAREKQKERA